MRGYRAPVPLELPEVALAFLATPEGRHAEKTLRVLHRWMQLHLVDYGQLTSSHVDAFLEKPAGAPVTALTRNGYRSHVRRFLDYLHAGGHVGFDTAWLRVRHKVLAAPAEDFLASLKPTLKPSTCGHYRGSLRSLHDWLDAEGVPLEGLARGHLERWLGYLHARGQSPATRVNTIVAVRVYLRALNDAGLLAIPADELLRPSDLPKLPVYLPRPLQPEADTALKMRLGNSPDPYQRGLLVMRNTGLRIGELQALGHDCVRADEDGNHFLKVPLGKMNNERLVPLDGPTLALVRELQAEGRQPRALLLETVRGRQTRHIHFQLAIQTATHGLPQLEGMTSHQLRHTYATSLMNAGMSLMGVMKLLGHRDYRMTLRYTEITLETVGKEYRAALTQMEQRYRLALKSPAPAKLDPDQALGAIIRWVQKRAGDAPRARRRAELLVKRLKRIREEVGELK